MFIDTPLPAQTPELRALWREAFGDTDDFLDQFWQTAFSQARCRCGVVDDEVAGALYWFDCLHKDRRIAYLYAVATAKKHRKQGVCHRLMADTHEHLKALGYEGSILVPGSASLFRLYADMGYAVCSSVRTFSCAAAQQPVPVREIGADEYVGLRRQLLPPDGVLQEKENIAFLQTQTNLYAAPGLLLAGRREEDRFVCTELLGDPYKAPGIVHALGCTEGTFRTPGRERPFAMYLPFKENAHPAPDYFGLAFD